MDDQSPRGLEASQQDLNPLVNRQLSAVNSYWVYLKFYPNAKAKVANLSYARKNHEVQLKLISFYCAQRKVMRIGHRPS